jgi:hypothetical protein
MELLRKGSRLSVQPVSEGEWAAVLELAGLKPSDVRFDAAAKAGSKPKSKSAPK